MIRLVDTPGFDDTSVSDEDILKKIMTELDSHQQLLGIIYLHRITDVRLSGSSSRGFKILQQLCPPESYEKIVLATTMWSDAEFSKGGLDAAKRREDQLWEYHWKPLFEGRSKMVRHHNTPESARRITELFLPTGKSLLPPAPPKPDSAIDLRATLESANEADLYIQHWLLTTTEDQSQPRVAETQTQARDQRQEVLVINAMDQDSTFKSRFPDDDDKTDNDDEDDEDDDDDDENNNNPYPYHQLIDDEWQPPQEVIHVYQPLPPPPPPPPACLLPAIGADAEKESSNVDDDETQSQPLRPRPRMGSEENRATSQILLQDNTHLVRRASWIPRRFSRRATSPAAAKALGWSAALVFFSGMAFRVGTFFSKEKPMGNPLAYGGQ